MTVKKFDKVNDLIDIYSGIVSDDSGDMAAKSISPKYIPTFTMAEYLEQRIKARQDIQKEIEELVNEAYQNGFRDGIYHES